MTSTLPTSIRAQAGPHRRCSGSLLAGGDGAARASGSSRSTPPRARRRPSRARPQPPVPLRVGGPGRRGGHRTATAGRSPFDGTLRPLAAGAGARSTGDRGPYRVLTALRQDDGSVVAVVRGLVRRGDAAPAPPAERCTRPACCCRRRRPSPAARPAGQLSTVGLPLLAQQWPGPLVDGFVTLSADRRARPSGLAPAPLALPEGPRSAAQRRVRDRSGGCSPDSRW